MNVYVITDVVAVKDTQEKAEEYCREYVGDPQEDRFATDPLGRSIHQYLSGRSWRWNKSGLVITPTVTS